MHEDGEDDDMVVVDGGAIGIEDAIGAERGGVDFFEGTWVEDVVGVEVDDVVALGLADAAVAKGVSPVFVVFLHAGDGDGEVDGGVEEGAIVVEEDFEILEKAWSAEGFIAAQEIGVGSRALEVGDDDGEAGHGSSWKRDGCRTVLIVLAEDFGNGAVTVFVGEFLVEDSVAFKGFVGPAAFGNPKLALHDELHGINVTAKGRLAGEDNAEFGMVFKADIVIHVGEEAAHVDGEDDDVIGVDGAVVLVENPWRSFDGEMDIFEGGGVEDVVGVEVNEVFALSLENAAVADGVSPVFVIFVHTDNGNGETDGGVQEWAVVVEEDFEILEGLGLE